MKSLEIIILKLSVSKLFKYLNSNTYIKTPVSKTPSLLERAGVRIILKTSSIKLCMKSLEIIILKLRLSKLFKYLNSNTYIKTTVFKSSLSFGEGWGEDHSQNVIQKALYEIIRDYNSQAEPVEAV